MKKITRRLIICLIILIIGVSLIILFIPKNSLKYSKQQLSVNPNLDSNITNIVILGIDKKESYATNDQIDTIIVLSVPDSGKEIKLSSILRDTFVMTGIPDEELKKQEDFNDDCSDKYNYIKLNAAYSLGGVPTVIKTLNLNFGLNIDKYVLVDFEMVRNVIDQLGGIEVDVKDETMMNQLNDLIEALNEFEYRNDPLIEKPGLQVLNGAQILAFIRNRTSSSDENRTSNQREIIKKIIQKFEETSLINKAKIFIVNYPNLETSMSIFDFLRLALNLRNKDSIESEVVPYSNLSREIDIYMKPYLVPFTLKDNVEKLEEFIYGKTFQLPETVNQISETLVNITAESSAYPTNQ